MKIYKLLLFVVTLCFTFAGCMSVEESKRKRDEDSSDGPAHQETSSRNPFNDIEPNRYTDNSLGFYSGDLPYRQPFRSPNVLLVSWSQREYVYCTKIQFFKQCGIIIISSDVVPLPYYFYGGNQPKYADDIYFREIAFLIHKDEIDSEGTICLEGNCIALIDHTKTRYEVLSAKIEFDNTINYGYNHGSFVVTYNTLSGETSQLTGGRFKLLPPSDDDLNGNLYQKYFTDLYANDKAAQEEMNDFYYLIGRYVE